MKPMNSTVFLQLFLLSPLKMCNEVNLYISTPCNLLELSYKNFKWQERCPTTKIHSYFTEDGHYHKFKNLWSHPLKNEFETKRQEFFSSFVGKGMRTFWIIKEVFRMLNEKEMRW